VDEHAQLLRARRAAAGVRRAAEAFDEFAERLSPVVGPAEMVEYDALVARETAALSERVDAFRALGLGAASIEDE
jgi:hypothetical protein